MAVEKLTRTTCDRCTVIVEEIPEDTLAATEAGPGPLLYVEAKHFGRQDAIVFKDLCEKCMRRIVSLLDQVELKKPDAEEETSTGNGSDKKKKKKKGANQAATPGGEETPDESTF